MTKSLYIHIPFCRKKCMYCDFFSIAYTTEQAHPYIDILCRQIEALPAAFDTIYIGGGTPTVLEPDLFCKLLGTLNKKNVQEGEFTVEANPESLSQDKLVMLRESGVNRISIGVQSLSNEKLQKLGRVHSAEESVDAVLRAESAGFKNISADFMYGIWEEELLDWKKELKNIAQLPLKHISAYTLTYEKKTPLFKRYQQNAIKALDDGVVAAMFKYTMSYLLTRGFLHYEVSNFAKEGFFCKHNLNYWHNKPYQALGASAVSYGNGRRIRYIPNVKEYVQCVTEGKDFVFESEELSLKERANETAALKIRTREGIGFRWFNEVTGYDFLRLYQEALAGLSRHKFIRYWPSKQAALGVCLTEKGFLYCDEASSAFL